MQRTEGKLIRPAGRGQDGGLRTPAMRKRLSHECQMESKSSSDSSCCWKTHVYAWANAAICPTRGGGRRFGSACVCPTACDEGFNAYRPVDRPIGIIIIMPRCSLGGLNGELTVMMKNKSRARASQTIVLVSSRGSNLPTLKPLERNKAHHTRQQ